MESMFVSACLGTETLGVSRVSREQHDQYEYINVMINPICSMGLVYLPIIWLKFMVNVGKIYHNNPSCFNMIIAIWEYLNMIIN